MSHRPLPRRRLLLSWPLATLAPWPVAALAQVGAVLPTPASLADEVAAALKRGSPLVVLASLHGCPFCKTVRESYLAPLRAEIALPVVQLDMGSDRALLDFSAQPTTHSRLLRDWGIRIAPTVLFFGRDGREAAPRLAGASIPDFYGAYLDERLATARKNLG